MVTFFSLQKNFRHKLQRLLLLCLFPVTMYAQFAHVERGFIPEKYNPKEFKVPVKNPDIYTFPLNLPPAGILAPKAFNAKNKVYLEHANKLSYDQFISPEYQILTGDVRFSHDGAILYCDSAHFYNTTNSLYAYGNVHMEQGDSVFLYGAWMFYEGNTKLAKVRQNVRLENGGMTLFTDSLNMDRVTNISYFFDGGLLVDSVNELSSEYGEYSSVTKIAEFKNRVKLKNPKFKLTTKQLIYHADTKVADIVRPTEIVSDSGYIYTTGGWYNTITEESKLLLRSYAVSDHKKLTADTLFYNRAKKIGEGFNKVVFEDSVQLVTLTGDYGYHDGFKDSTILTKNALYVDHSSKDTLYLHADTLISLREVFINKDSLKSGKDSIALIKPLHSTLANKNDSSLKADKPLVPKILEAAKDTLAIEKPAVNSVELKNDATASKKDTAFYCIKAYNGVRFFKKDIQGICDTLLYSGHDSIMNLNNYPVLWSEKQQLSGDKMMLYTKYGKPDMLHVIKSAMAVSYETDSLYNQVSGKDLKAFFDSSEVVRIEVDGNAETIFLPRDKDKELMGFNRMEGSSMTIFRKNGKMQKLILWPQPKGKFYPLEKIDPQAKYLKNFEWLEALRPKDPKDVMTKTPDVRIKSKSGKSKSSAANEGLQMPKGTDLKTSDGLKK
jgi:lipopolysaccharide export system protein LptA